MEYQHGGDIYSHNILWDFSANINPYGMPGRVRQALLEAVDDCIRYPDSRCRALKKALSEFHKLDESVFLCGNGAADLIFQAVLAVKPKKVLIPAPSFSEYEQALKTVDCEIHYFHLPRVTEFVLDIGQMIHDLDQTYDMVFLCNPNNPTGSLISLNEMQRILSHCMENGILLFVDECFLDFTEEGQSWSLLPMCPENQNLIVLKAFTKMYGMAGVRLGYAVTANAGILETMEGLRQPWSISGLAQAAGLAALEERDMAEKVKRLLRTERPFVAEELRKLGFQVFESAANYLLFTDWELAGERELYECCKEKGLLIRWCGNYIGLGGRDYRICIKTREENLRLLQILSQIMEERKQRWQNRL